MPSELRRRAGLLAVILLLAASATLRIAYSQAARSGAGAMPDAQVVANPPAAGAAAVQNPVADWTLVANGPIDNAGDVNGDGYDDVIISDQASGSSGWIAVFNGSPTGLGRTTAWWVPAGYDQGFGMGDVNGDGYDDIVLDHHGLEGFYGGLAGLPATSNWHASGTWETSVAGNTGDINCDGFDDLLVGDHSYTNGQTNEGILEVFYGSPTGLSATPGWTLEGNETNRNLGAAVAAAGDVNKDGCADIIASDRFSGNSRYYAVYLGSAAGPSPSPNWVGLISYAGSMSSAGDVNCDGFGDVITGDPRIGNSTGRVAIYLGSPGGLPSSPTWTIDGDRSASGFGTAAVAAGDVNGDGCDDVAIGAPNYVSNTAGYLFVYLGSSLGMQLVPTWTAYQLYGGDGFGYRASTAGDVNGDGYDDLLGARREDDWLYAVGTVYGYYGTAAGLRETIVSAHRTSQPPAIDGDLADWEPVPRFALDRTSAETIAGAAPAPEDSAATLRAKWDLLNLYLAVHVADDRIVNDSGDVWRDDEIELAFWAVYDGNPAGGDTHQYTVNADGRVTDFGQPNPPIEAVALPVEGGWNVEVRIPATHLFGLYTHLYEGQVLAFNAGLHDDDDGGDWDSYLIWQGASTATNGEAFGTMRLIVPGAPPPTTPTPTATPPPPPTPTRTVTPTPTRYPTPTPTAMPWPNLSPSTKSAWPTVVAYDQPILYSIRLINNSRFPGQVTMIDVPPLPYAPDTAWGGLVWDPVTRSLRWQGPIAAGEIRLFGYTLTAPSSCAAPGTVYTNTLTIDDGNQPVWVRSAPVVVTGPTPWASCTPTATPTVTPTATPTATATATPTMTPTPWHRYLPLIVH